MVCQGKSFRKAYSFFSSDTFNSYVNHLHKDFIEMGKVGQQLLWTSISLCLDFTTMHDYSPLLERGWVFSPHSDVLKNILSKPYLLTHGLHSMYSMFWLLSQLHFFKKAFLLPQISHWIWRCLGCRWPIGISDNRLLQKHWHKFFILFFPTNSYKCAWHSLTSFCKLLPFLQPTVW